jgi:putative ABC transport system permease protein
MALRTRFLLLGWRQLNHNRLRFLAAVAGITFAVLLMLMQQGFRAALFDSSLRWHKALQYDLVMLSPKAECLLCVHDFPRNRVLQANGIDGVLAVTPVYIGTGQWRNPDNPEVVWPIFIAAFDPEDQGFGGIISDTQRARLRLPDHYLFDALSRPEYGPIPETLDEQGSLSLEMNSRRVQIDGQFEVGTSFGINGALITSDLNYLRLLPERNPSNVSAGLLHLEPGVDPATTRDAILESLPPDVMVLTRDEFMAMEVSYWNYNTPIGYVFNFGVIMGFVVGAIIVYQILFSDVQDHLKEYATLKAIGYTDGYLAKVVLQQAAILAVAGFIPALLLTWQLFKQAADATNLPLMLTPGLSGQVLALALGMCVGAGLLALRKVRSADPADVF